MAKQRDSDFEVFAMHQIHALGCETIPQVGVTGYIIDMDIRHPDWPHGFILDLLRDGVSHHSAKSARNRVRLSQDVPKRPDWHLHPI